VYYFISCLSVASPERERCFPPLSGTHFASSGSKLVDDSDALRREILMIANQSEALNRCVDVIEALECLVTLPVCNTTTGRVVPVCPTLCAMIDIEIAECRDFFANNSNLPAVNHLLTINCSNPTTYYIFPRGNIENDIENGCIMFSECYSFKYTDLI